MDPEITKKIIQASTSLMKPGICEQMAFSFHCHMKIVVAMVTDIVKMLQVHIDPRDNSKTIQQAT